MRSDIVIWVLGAAAVLCLLAFQPAAFAQNVLDRESAECVNCHSSAVSPPTSPSIYHAEGFSHPVGVDYMALAAGNPGLRNPASLNPAIRLVNGRIACITCHVPYSEYDHKALARKRKEMPSIPDPMLAVDNTRSGLCTACHMK